MRLLPTLLLILTAGSAIVEAAPLQSFEELKSAFLQAKTVNVVVDIEECHFEHNPARTPNSCSFRKHFKILHEFFSTRNAYHIFDHDLFVEAIVLINSRLTQKNSIFSHALYEFDTELRITSAEEVFITYQTSEGVAKVNCNRAGITMWAKD